MPTFGGPEIWQLKSTMSASVKLSFQQSTPWSSPWLSLGFFHFVSVNTFNACLTGHFHGIFNLSKKQKTDSSRTVMLPPVAFTLNLLQTDKAKPSYLKIYFVASNLRQVDFDYVIPLQLKNPLRVAFVDRASVVE